MISARPSAFFPAELTARRRRPSSGSWHSQSLALAHAELGQHDRSFKAAQEAMEVVETRSMQALPPISLAFTAFGQSQAASGKLEEAMATLEHGLALRRKAPALSPWPTNAPPPCHGPSRHHDR